MNPDLVIVLSGIAELALGAGLLAAPRYRKPLGWLTAALFVAVFPGNVWQYVHGSDAFGLNTDRARFIRLFFQPVLIAWALWSTGALFSHREEDKEPR